MRLLACHRDQIQQLNHSTFKLLASSPNCHYEFI